MIATAEPNTPDRPPTRRRERKTLLALVATSLAVTLIAAPIQADGPAVAEAQLGLPEPDEFYDPPELPTGPPGTTIKAEEVEPYFDPIKMGASAFRLALPDLLPVPPGQVDAWRFMHTSRDATNQSIALTGTLLQPKAAWDGPGPRPLLAYAVGGHGMDDTCTPSWQMINGIQYELPLIVPYLQAGFSVVVTDYQRYPTHTFAEPASAGQAVLDSVRAATRLEDEQGLPVGIDDSTPVVIGGYSEGGNAAAAAAERQPTYAPEINLKGVAAGGVPADLRATANATNVSLLTGVIFMAINALDTSYPELDAADLPLNALGRAAVRDVRGMCMPEMTQSYSYRSHRIYTQWGRSLDGALAKAPEWEAKLEELRIGREMTPEAPVLVYHGRLDPWVPYDGAVQMANEWCSRGANVTFKRYTLAEHFITLAVAIPHTTDWLMARATGAPVSSGCDDEELS